MREVGSFAAIGDSFTEGYGDYYPDGSCQGWADRVARMLAAIAMQPDLISLAAGGNDLLRPKADPEELAAAFEQAVVQLRSAADQMLLFSGFDPGGLPLMRPIRDNVIAYNSDACRRPERATGRFRCDDRCAHGKFGWP